MPNEISAGYGFLYEMGCGKTLTTIAVMGALYEQKKIRSALVVCPATVIPVWPSEMERFADFDFRVAALTGTMAQRLKAVRQVLRHDDNVLQLIICNYEALRNDEMLLTLLEWRPDMVILDEMHSIKSPTAVQTMACQQLGSVAKYRIGLTGTVIPNSVEDVYSQFRFLDGTVFPDNYYAFLARYAVKGGFNNKKIVATKNEQELSQRMQSVSYRVTKAECLDLPEETYIDLPVQLSPKERRLYDSMRLASFAELEAEQTVTASTVLTKLLRLQQITGGFLKADGEDGKVEQVGTSKLDALRDILTDYVLENKKKLVIFCRFLAEVDAVCNLLTSLKIGWRCITGSVPMDERGKCVDDFQNDPDVKVFVGQIDSVSLGLTLHAASTAVIYSSTYNFASYEQCLARIHRKGQTQPCTYIHLVAERTVDSKIIQALRTKRDFAKRIVDSDWRTLFD